MSPFFETPFNFCGITFKSRVWRQAAMTIDVLYCVFGTDLQNVWITFIMCKLDKFESLAFEMNRYHSFPF